MRERSVPSRRPPEGRSRLRFICTIGPATRDRARLHELRAAGMDIARINGAHGTLEDVRALVRFVRAEAPPGTEILLDLPGNKVRTDNIDEPIHLVTGTEFALPADRLTYPSLHALVRPGHRISASDGQIQLEVVRVEGTVIVTRVLAGGLLANRKGVNITGIHDTMPFDFERDINLLNIAIETGVDYVGLSFVRSVEHVRRIKAQLVGTDIRVVAKVETADAVDRLATILDEANVIMIDRGDLEAEVGRERIPLIQKWVIREARKAHVPVIVASQFLTTMLERPLPVMAEVSDIANAVLDSADILMLSEETAIGKYPVACIETMARIARVVEEERDRALDVFILAAGASTGFGSLTTNKHKCMLDVGGQTIIAHQIGNLRAAGLRDESITVVTGHNHQQIAHYLRGEGFGGHFVYNPWYATTNMLVSLWLARPRDRGFLVVYGDIIFDRQILVDLLAARGDIVLAVDQRPDLDPEDEKVVVHRGRVVRASKDIEPEAAFGEFIGLMKVSTAAAAALVYQELEAVVQEGDHMAFVTRALERLASRGVPIHICHTQDRPWGDNDCLADLTRSRETIFPRILEAHRRAADAVPEPPRSRPAGRR